MQSKNGAGPQLADFMREQSGTSFSEHALLASLVVVVCLIALLAICKGP